MYMDMAFAGQGGAKVPVAPKQAIQSIGAASVVYIPVAAEEGRFVERAVKTGETAADGLRVLEGLKAGETVVTEGSVFLRAEALRQHPR